MPPSTNQQSVTPSESTVKTPKIDLQALADKIYELMKRELRLERQRLGRSA